MEEGKWRGEMAKRSQETGEVTCKSRDRCHSELPARQSQGGFSWVGGAI